jgi:hypothetical protein
MTQEDLKKLISILDLEFKPFVLTQEWWKQLKAGMLIKTKKDELYLIGHVNCLLGVCDDCRDFSKEDIIEYVDVFDKLLNK